MSYSSTASHVTTLQGFHFSDYIKADLPLSAPKRKKTTYGQNLILYCIAKKVLDLLVLCIIILCLECFHCYAIIDCWLTLISCTFQPMVALINHLLTYLLHPSPVCLDGIGTCSRNRVYKVPGVIDCLVLITQILQLAIGRPLV